MSTSRMIKVVKEATETPDVSTYYIEGENWGPVITAKDEEAKSLFTKALKASLLMENILSINELLN